MNSIQATPVAPAQPQDPRRRRWVEWVLPLIAAAVLVGLAWDGHRTARQAEAEDASERLLALRGASEVHVLGLRAELEHYDYLPSTVARHPDLIAMLEGPDDATRISRVNAYLEEVNRRAGSLVLYVLDVKGKTLAASNCSSPDGFCGNVYADRPYFRDAVSGGSGLFYGVGKTTGVPGLFISAPVRRGDTVIGVAVVKLDLQVLEKAWAELRDPILLRDQRGIVFLSAIDAWRYRSTPGRPLSAADRAELDRTQQYGPPGRAFEPLPWKRVDSPDGGAGYVVQELDGRRRRFLAIDVPVDAARPELGWKLTVLADDALAGDAYLAALLERLRGNLAAVLVCLGVLVWSFIERRKESSFRRAMEESLPVGIRIRDLKGRILYVNPALCEMTGYSETELVGRVGEDPYWHPDDIEQHWANYRAVLSGQAPRTGFESRIRHRDGHDVQIKVYVAKLIQGRRHTGWMSCVVDVTEQRRIEDERRKLDKRLQLAGNRAIVNELSSTLAHELVQPLRAISNWARAAQGFADLKQGLLDTNAMNGIAEQAGRALGIIKGIQDRLRQQPTQAVAVSLNEIVETVGEFLQPEFRRLHSALELQLQRDLPLVSGTPLELEQVLLNLILNALQAMQEVPMPQRSVSIRTESMHGAVRVLVIDRGPGVSEAAREQLFSHPITTRPEGLGLGLGICRSIVERHGGQLSYEPAAGGGAVFIIQLPCKP